MTQKLYLSWGTILYFYRLTIDFREITSEVIVLTKSVKTLTAILVALAAYGVSTAPANANPIGIDQGVLISQLTGHDLYNKGSQLALDDYGIGRVRGVVGNILFIEFLKYPGSASSAGYFTRDNQRYTHIHLPGSAQPGDDVMVRYNGSAKIWEASTAHPAWISRLNLKEIPTFEKTAIDFDSTAPVSLPPVQPSAPPVYTPEPVPAPVRGLW
jgi:hypothetical protein